MDWSEERYVRLYTRLTANWMSWPWEARATFPNLLMRTDRTGLVDVPPGADRVRKVAGLIMLPREVVATGLEALLEDGCLEQSDAGYIFRNFIGAQEAKASEAKRSREYRERKRDATLANRWNPKVEASVTLRDDSSRGARGPVAGPADVTLRDEAPESVGPESGQNGPDAEVDVTKRDAASHGVANRHAAPRDVTGRHPLPCCAVEGRKVSPLPPQMGLPLLASVPTAGAAEGEKFSGLPARPSLDQLRAAMGQETATPAPSTAAAGFVRWAASHTGEVAKLTPTYVAHLERAYGEAAAYLAKHGCPEDRIAGELRTGLLAFSGDRWSRTEGRDGSLALFLSSTNVWLGRTPYGHRLLDQLSRRMAR